MVVEVRMPAYSESMEEADVVGWLVAPGDSVKEGDPIAEIETDKATGELESPASGILSEILIAEGTQGVKVGELLARIEPVASAAAEASESASQSQPGGKRSSASAEPEPAALSSGGKRANAPDAASAEPETSSVREASAVPEPSPRPDPDLATSTRAAPVPATALARRLADRAGLEISSIAGSGASGRVLKADVEAVSAGQVGATPRTATETRPVSQAIPSFATTQLRVECRAEHALAVCQRLSAREPEIPIPMLALILRAAAGALREVPQANLAWREGQLVEADSIELALGQPSASGERVALVQDADRMSLSALAEMIALADTGATPPLPETTLASLAVVDVGGANIESIQLPVSPPCVLALGTGAPTERPMAVDGGLDVGVVMTCTLTADTRAVDPGSAARLLAAFKLRLEEPLEMLLQ